MPLICYRPRAFSELQNSIIARVNLIIKDYAAQGYDLTVRQLHYQFVSRNYYPDSWADPGSGVKNNIKNYNRLQDLISEGRIAGLIDWDAIVDRTRNVRKNQHWVRPSQIIESALNTYEISKWEEQEHYCEVWVEKDALVGVLGPLCSRLDVPLFSCRGYTSQSEAWAAAQRLLNWKEKGKEVHIIHLGDHDPSGIDMSRDIFERLSLFTYSRVHVQRIALNMPQVEKYDPPPNPAKVTDSRAAAYIERYGEESWELDALEPAVLTDLVTRAVSQYRDEALWAKAVKDEKRGKHTLQCIVQYFPDVVKFLRERRKKDDSPVICAGCGATENNPKCLCDDTINRGIQLED